MAKNKKIEHPHYEMLYIIPNKYTETEIGPIQEEVRGLIEKHAGKVTYAENWGKKKLMYTINGFNHGFYALFEFDCDAANLKNINEEMRLDQKILRFMIVSKRLRSEEEIKAEKRKAEEIMKKEAKETEEKKEKEEKQEMVKPKDDKKVDLKDLDEKLDRILDTDDLL
jgi:small subunit ribosomal protein S6